PAQVATLPSGAELSAKGLTPLVMPNDRFYRIDTSLAAPTVDAPSGGLRVGGIVAHEVTLTYAALAQLPLFEQYVTIACVSNEVGGPLGGHATWNDDKMRTTLEQS